MPSLFGRCATLVTGITLVACWTSSTVSPAFGQTGGAFPYWSTYQGNAAHTGYVPTTLNPGSYSLKWQMAVSSTGINPIAEGDGKVYITTPGYFSSTSGISVLSASTGLQLWNAAIPNVFSVNSPAYANGTVYVQAGKGTSSPPPYLTAYNASTGAVNFQAPFSAQWERYLAPTPYGGNIYVDGGYYGGMYSFSGTSGSQNWFNSSLPQYDGWTPAVDGQYCYAFTGGVFSVVNMNTGVTAGGVTVPFSWGGWTMNAAVALGAQNDAFAINGGTLWGFTTTVNGNPLPHVAWSTVNNYTGQATVANGRVYAIDGGNLDVLNESTGALLWSWTPPAGQSLQGTMIATNNELLAATSNATYAIDLRSHQQVWSYPRGGSLALSENTLYIADSSGGLTAINAFFLPAPNVWNLNHGGSWATGGNWTPPGPANGIDATADFSQQGLSADATVTLDGSWTVGTMLFADTAAAHNWSLNPGSGGTLTLQSSQGVPSISVFNQTAAINTVLSGSQGLTVSGSGTLVLAANNLYSGNITISGGTLGIYADDNLGASANPLAIGGAALEAKGSFATARSIMLSSPTSMISVDGGATLTLASGATVGGSGGLTKAGPGLLDATAAVMSYTGSTAVTGGTLSAASVTNSTPLAVSAGATANFTAPAISLGAVDNDGLLNFTSSVGSIGVAALSGGGNANFSGAAAVGVFSSGSMKVAGAAQVATASGGVAFFNGPTASTGALSNSVVNLSPGTVLSVAAGNQTTGTVTGGGSLVVNGGLLVLANSNNYGGGTTVASGTLQVGNGGTSGSIVGDVLDNATLVFQRSDNVVFPGNIRGSGALVQSGAGLLTITGSNSYLGPTFVTAGTLQMGAATALPPTTALTVNAGAVLDLNGVNCTAAGIGGSGIVALGSATLTLKNMSTTLLSAQVVGSGMVVKDGPGTLVLTADEGYTGGTNIVAGTLQIGNSGPSGSLLGNLVDNGSLVFNRSGTSAFAGTISGSGSVTTIGSGVLTMSGGNTYSGPTIVSGGVLALANSSALPAASTLTLSINNGISFAPGIGTFNVGGLSGPGNIALTDAASAPVTLQFGGNGLNTTDSGVLSGGGAVAKIGSGTTTLAAANTYAGPTTVQNGILVLQGSTQSSGFTAAAGGTLQVAGAALTLTYQSLTAQAGGAVQYNGATINGGYLRGPGTHTSAAGATSNFNGVTTYNSTVFQQNGPANFTNFGNGGRLANNAPLSWSGGANASSGQVSVNSTLNVQDWTNNGALTINGGGVVNNAVSDVVFGGGSRTTVNPGGQFNADSDGSGSALDLNGALLVNNGIVTGTTNVYYGSLAQGAGVYGPVNVYTGGSFKPGNSPGSVETGDVAWNAGGRYVEEMNDAIGAAGVNWDYWSIDGVLDMRGGTTPNSRLVVELESYNGVLTGDFQNSQDYQWPIASASGGIIGFDPSAITVDASGFINPLNGGRFSVVQVGNSLDLVYTVPEPSTLGLAAAAVFGLLGCACGRRRPAT